MSKGTAGALFRATQAPAHGAPRVPLMSRRSRRESPGARRSLKAPRDHCDVERIELDAATDPAWKSDPAKNNYANRLRSRSAFRPGPINGDCCHFATLPAKAPSLPLASRESPCCSAQRTVPHSLTASRDWLAHGGSCSNDPRAAFAARIWLCSRQDNTGGFNDDKLKKVLCRDH
jgi:hypothetical protein